MKSYNREEVFTSSLVYFRGDELAANVWINKYALKDSDGKIYELNPDDMHRRIASELARIEEQYINPLTEDEIYELIKDFEYVIPQGGPMSGIGNTMQTVSLSNCFVVGNEADSYGGITQTDQEQIQLMKRRGGVGHDLSHIRPKGSPVKNSALTSTGVVPFMERFSNSTREVAQDGRRGALMLSISIKHPDSIDFIDAKVTPGKITGANVSVKIDDEFMNAVKANTNYIQQFPITGVPRLTKDIDAKELFNKIVFNAWKSAEPGILFWDTIIKESVPDCYADLGYKTVSTNPCVVGDTIIATADGRNGVNIKQLVEEGKDVPVYSTNIETGKVEIKVARNPRLTGQKKEVWKLTLDDNSTLIATPNHKILLKTLEYVELKDLKPGDSIIPFYSFNSNGYRQVSNTGEKMTGGARRNRRQYRLINEFYNGKIDACDSIIHHKDFNSFNDSIDNLQIMSKSEHVKLHSKNMIGKLNPYHRMTQEWKKKFASKPGEKNPNFSGYSNQELIKHGKLLFEKNGLITKRKWAEYAKENNLPQDLVGDFRFNSFSDFKNQVAENHKVKYVEFYGYEDVYNITVDDNHNYHIITSNEDSQYITSSGICIKNCGEIPLCPYDSCRLIAINLYSYVINPFTDKAEFDYVLFEEHVAYTQRIMDDIIDLEMEKIDSIIEKIDSDPEDSHFKRTEKELWEKIKEKTIKGRRTGIGVTAEGDMLAAMGFTYGTPEATAFSENIHKTLAVNAYKASAKLAKERGSFEVYDFEREKNNPFIKRLFEASPELEDLMKEYGRRNIALLTIAPTGTTSLMTQTTSGIEPVFKPAYMRRRKINPNDKDTKAVFIDDVGDHWEEYPIFHPKFLKWAKIKGHDVDKIKIMKAEELAELVKQSPYYKASSEDVDWVEKVKMQGAIQKWVDHSISVTVNLPAEATEEIVGNVYMAAWESGCKGVTVYREGSRSGVLVSNQEKKQQSLTETMREHSAPKRPKIIDCDVVRFSNQHDKWIGFVGLLDKRPYEIFTGKTDSFPLPASVETGKIKKVKDNGNGSRYDFVYIDKDGYEQEVRGLNRVFDKEYWNIAKTFSGLLRHGMPIVNVYELVCSLKFDGDGFNTWKSGLKRMIKKYIDDGTVAKGEICPNCHSDHIVYQDGCLSCKSCGWQKCSA